MPRVEITSEKPGRLIVAAVGGNCESSDSTTPDQGQEYEKILLIALSAFAVVAHAEASASHGKLLSVSTFTANGASVELSSVQRPDGKVCRQYVRDVSLGADKKTTIRTGTYCDGDKLSQG